LFFGCATFLYTFINQNNPVWYCFLRLPSLIGLQKFGPPVQERDVPTISRQTFGPWVACLSLFLSIYQPLIKHADSFDNATNRYNTIQFFHSYLRKANEKNKKIRFQELAFNDTPCFYAKSPGGYLQSISSALGTPPAGVFPPETFLKIGTEDVLKDRSQGMSRTSEVAEPGMSEMEA